MPVQPGYEIIRPFTAHRKCLWGRHQEHEKDGTGDAGMLDRFKLPAVVRNDTKL
jgi:hypothetical protein